MTPRCISLNRNFFNFKEADLFAQPESGMIHKGHTSLFARNRSNINVSIRFLIIVLWVVLCFLCLGLGDSSWNYLFPDLATQTWVVDEPVSLKFLAERPNCSVNFKIMTSYDIKAMDFTCVFLDGTLLLLTVILLLTCHRNNFSLQ